MDEESPSTSQDSSNSSEAVQMNTGVSLHIVNLREVHCALCGTIYSPGNEPNRHLNVCQVFRESRQRVEEAVQGVAEIPQRVEEALQSFAETRRISEEIIQIFEDNRQRIEEAWQVLAENQRILNEQLWQCVERRLEGLPRLVITEEHEKKHNGLQCAICLDPLLVGRIVNQLPCLHLFHPLCIVPWLKVRMSCPTCRYKLSSAFHNETRQNSNRRIEFQEIVHERSNVNSSSATYDVNEPEVVVNESYNEATDSSVRDREGPEGRRGGWFLFAAAPIVSLVTLVGIALVECFQNFPGDGRGRGSTGHVKFSLQCQQQVRMVSSGSSSTRTSNSSENN